MTRVAAIDCGTNSTRLLVADADAQGNLTDLYRDMRITRLGQNVDRSGMLSEAALARTFAAAEEYHQKIVELGATRIRVVATSATRDARNRSDFIAGMREALGVEPEVISGEEEAALSFQGAISSLPELEVEGSVGDYLVVDIGGGSTEFVCGAGLGSGGSCQHSRDGNRGESSGRNRTRDKSNSQGAATAAISTNMGSVRVTERFGPEPWESDNLQTASAWIDEWLDQADAAVDFSRVGCLVGVAGTVTTIAAHALGCDSYRPDLTHGAQLSETAWQQAIDFMISTPVSKKAALGIMPPGRADVIGGGALIWRRILARIIGGSFAGSAVASSSESALAFSVQRSGGASATYSPSSSPSLVPTKSQIPVVVSEHDILDGIAQALANGE